MNNKPKVTCKFCNEPNLVWTWDRFNEKNRLASTNGIFHICPAVNKGLPKKKVEGEFKGYEKVKRY